MPAPGHQARHWLALCMTNILLLRCIFLSHIMDLWQFRTNFLSTFSHMQISLIYWNFVKILDISWNHLVPLLLRFSDCYACTSMLSIHIHIHIYDIYIYRHEKIQQIKINKSVKVDKAKSVESIKTHLRLIVGLVSLWGTKSRLSTHKIPQQGPKIEEEKKKSKVLRTWIRLQLHLPSKQCRVEVLSSKEKKDTIYSSKSCLATKKL